MASGSSDINYFPENQMTTFSALWTFWKHNVCFNVWGATLQFFCSGSRNTNFTSSSNNIHVIQLCANKKL